MRLLKVFIRSVGKYIGVGKEAAVVGLLDPHNSRMKKDWVLENGEAIRWEPASRTWAPIS